MTRRDDAVLILAEVLREGFRFGPGWMSPYRLIDAPDHDEAAEHVEDGEPAG